MANKPRIPKPGDADAVFLEDGVRVALLAALGGTTTSSGESAGLVVAEVTKDLSSAVEDEYLETIHTLDGSEAVPYTLEVPGIGAYSYCTITAVETVAGDGTIVRVHSSISGQPGTVFSGQGISGGVATHSFIPGTAYRIPLGVNTLLWKAQASAGVNATTGTWRIYIIYHKGTNQTWLAT